MANGDKERKNKGSSVLTGLPPTLLLSTRWRCCPQLFPQLTGASGEFSEPVTLPRAQDGTERGRCWGRWDPAPGGLPGAHRVGAHEEGWGSGWVTVCNRMLQRPLIGHNSHTLPSSPWGWSRGQRLPRVEM